MTQKETKPTGAKILICEDDPDLAELIGLFLQKNGFRFDNANSAETAKTFLAKEKYDAITVDISLPGQDGISLIQELKENSQNDDLPVVVISISDRSEHYRKLSLKGIETSSWVTKPITETSLISAINRALRSA